MGGGSSKTKKGAKYPVFNKRYEIDETQRLGTGSFGRVFVGQDHKTGEPVAIKVELKKGGRLREEGKVYQDLEGVGGIPALLWQGNTSGYSALVLTLLGPSLDDLRLLCKSFHHEIDKKHRHDRSRDSSPITSPEQGPSSPKLLPEPEPLMLGASAGSIASVSPKLASTPQLEEGPRDDVDILGISVGSISHPQARSSDSRDRTFSQDEVAQPAALAIRRDSHPRAKLCRSSTTPAIEVQAPPVHSDASGQNDRTPQKGMRGSRRKSDHGSGLRHSPGRTMKTSFSRDSVVSSPGQPYHSAPSFAQSKPSGAALSLSTVCVIAVQAIDILRGIHERGWVHRDLKPANFVMRRDENTSMNNHLYLLDFGLAKKFIDPKTKKHVAEPKGMRTKRATGTPLFASRNAHLDVTQSRRDDMESLGYVLLFLLRDTLPWRPGPLIAKDMQEAYIKHTKLTTPLEKLVTWAQVPECLASYMSNVIALEHAEKPEYEKLREMFISQLEVLSGTRDYMKVRCDWTRLGRQKHRDMARSTTRRPRHLRVNTDSPGVSASTDPGLSPGSAVSADDHLFSGLSEEPPSPTTPRSNAATRGVPERDASGKGGHGEEDVVPPIDSIPDEGGKGRKDSVDLGSGATPTTVSETISSGT